MKLFSKRRGFKLQPLWTRFPPQAFGAFHTVLPLDYPPTPSGPPTDIYSVEDTAGCTI